jgi:hypothetical protein
MVGVIIQTGTSVGRQLVFFLFLLVPGYLAVRAYYWANVALENDARVNRLVLMAIGGFVSLAVVALWRQLFPTIQFAPLAFLTPKWLVVDGVLSVRTISRLSVSESVNLIVSQGVVALIVGYGWGTLKYVTYDQRQPNHADLERPWEQVVDRVGKDDQVEIVTTDGQRIIGKVEALGSPTRDYDILVANARPVNGQADHRPDRVYEFVYFYDDDISRLVIHTGDTSPGSTPLQDGHQKVTKSLSSRLPSNLPDDETEEDPGKSLEYPQPDNDE